MKITKTAIMVMMGLLVFLGRATMAAPHSPVQPTWSEMSALLGHNVSEPLVYQFAAKYDLTLGHKLDAGLFIPNDESYALLFRGDKISTIILNVGPWPNTSDYREWKNYTRPLPFRLLKSQKPQSVAAIFGKPIYRGATTWVHGGYRVMITYVPNKASMQAIYLSQQATVTKPQPSAKGKITNAKSKKTSA